MSSLVQVRPRTRSRDAQTAALIERLEDPAARVNYVLTAVRSCRGISRWHTNRAYMLACNVLGVKYELGGVQFARAFALGPDELTAGVTGSVEPFCGYVYHAVAQNEPDRVKIGFSRSPHQRIARLCRNFREPLRLISAVPGTMLDEHAAHCAVWDRRIRRLDVKFGREWFRLPEMRAA